MRDARLAAAAAVLGAAVAVAFALRPATETISVDSRGTGSTSHYEITVTFADGSTTSGAVTCGSPIQAAGYLTTGHGPAAFNACTSYFESQVASYYFSPEGRDVCRDLIAETRQRRYHGGAHSPPVRATLP